MAGTTANLALPYPTGGDPANQGDDKIKALAEALDTFLKTTAVAMTAGASVTNNCALTRSGKNYDLTVDITATAAKAAGSTLMTITNAADRPPKAKYFWGIDSASAASQLMLLDTDGTLKLVTATRANGDRSRGTVSYQVA